MRYHVVCGLCVQSTNPPLPLPSPPSIALRRFSDVPEIVDLVDSSIQPSKTHTNGTKIVMMLFPLFEEGTVWDIIEHAGGSEQQLHPGPWPFDERRALQVLPVQCVSDL